MSGIQDVHRAFQNEDIHEDWETVYRRDPHLRIFNEKLMDRILQRLDVSTGPEILDAGCGTGEHSVRLAQRGFQCVGVDISEVVLQKAELFAEQRQCASKLSFETASLEGLPFPDGRFDAVHCRGVLMHIPRWREAVGQLCRVLKPGGRIAILESNCASLEMLIVRLVRLLRKGNSQVKKKKEGLEFWTDSPNEAPLTRAFRMRYLVDELREHDVHLVTRFATEFWDLNRFPGGWLRSLAARCNTLYFSLCLPAVFCSGNCIIAEKAPD